MKYLILILLLPLTVWAETIDLVYEGASDKRSRSNASNEIIKKAVDETSKDYIKQIIGEVKYNRNQDVIENKIIKNYGKYISYIKGGSLEYDKEKKQNLMSVSMKVSLDNLKRLLLASGLLYKSDNTPKILPLIRIVDHVKFQKNSWWSSAESKNSYFDDIIKLFHGTMDEVFSEKDFYTLTPLKSKSYIRIPGIFKNANLRKEETLTLGAFFGSEIVVDGEISINKNSSLLDNYKVNFNLSCKQVNNGRIIGEVRRVYITETGDYRTVVHEALVKNSKKVVEDLMEQIEDSWQKGVFGSNSLLLVLKGDLDYFQVKKLKNELESLNSIRLLKDRYYSSDLIKFEADVPMGVRKFSDLLEVKKFKSFRVKVDDVDTGTITLKVKPI